LAKAGAKTTGKGPSPEAGPPAGPDREVAELCARIALDRKAQDVRVLHVGKKLGISDYFVLATVHNRRQARAVRDAIRLALKAEGAGVPSASSEDPDGRWSLYDYGGVVLHLFDAEGRRYFDLDGRWAEAAEVPVSLDDARPGERAAS
jgi:ribosome-associated protein